MTLPSEFVRKVIGRNGGRVVGKTRLQKSLYFLEAAGVGGGLDFEYYHYGPYSEDASIAIDDAIALGIINQRWCDSQQGRSYAVFEAPDYVEVETSNTVEHHKCILEILRNYDSISLELAATADFLRKSGYEDFWNETVTRKSMKASKDRLKKAQSLLSDFYTETEKLSDI